MNDFAGVKGVSYKAKDKAKDKAKAKLRLKY